MNIVINNQLTAKETADLADLINPVIHAYRQGITAAESNQTLQDCPFEGMTVERKAWFRGYRAARNTEVK